MLMYVIVHDKFQSYTESNPGPLKQIFTKQMLPWSQFHKFPSTNCGALNTSFGVPNTKNGGVKMVFQHQNLIINYKNKFWCFKNHS